MGPGDLIFFCSSTFTHYNLEGDEGLRHSLTLFAHGAMLEARKHHADPAEHEHIVERREQRKSK